MGYRLFLRRPPERRLRNCPFLFRGGRDLRFLALRMLGTSFPPGFCDKANMRQTARKWVVAPLHSYPLCIALCINRAMSTRTGEPVLYERFPACLRALIKAYGDEQAAKDPHWKPPYTYRFMREWGFKDTARMRQYVTGRRVPPKLELLQLVHLASRIQGGLDILLGGLLGTCAPGQGPSSSPRQQWLRSVGAVPSSSRLRK